MTGVAERFPVEVAAVLTGAGWSPGHRDEARARDWALQLASYASPSGRQHAMFPAAVEAFAEFGAVAVEQDGPGEELARTSFILDPMRALYTVDTLAEFAGRVGEPLAPLGDEDDGAATIAVDPHGRVFVLDHTGEWFLGDSLDGALCALILGRRPARVSEAGTWT